MIVTVPRWIKWFLQLTSAIETKSIVLNELDQCSWFVNVHKYAAELKQHLLKNIRDGEMEQFSFGAGDIYTEETVHLSKLLVEICRYPYEKKPSLGNGHSEEIINKCNYHLQTLQDIAEVCGMIPGIEGQTKLYELRERNYGTATGTVNENNRFEPHYWKHAFSDKMYENLRKKASNYTQLNVKLLPPKQIEDQLKVLVNHCRTQPISSMILPCVLTLYCINPNDNPFVYPKLKSLQVYKTAAVRENVFLLHDQIQQIVKQQIYDAMQHVVADLVINDYKKHVAFEPCLPRFDWAKIIRAFCHAHNITLENDVNFVWACFVLSQKKNGIPAELKSALRNKPYHKELQYLIKLCNYNTFLCIRSGVKLAGARHAALENLRKNKIIPATKPQLDVKTSNSDWDVYLDYLKPYFKEEVSFSTFALSRYCQLPIAMKYFEHMSYGVFELQADYALAAEEFIDDMCSEFKATQFIEQRFWDRPHTLQAICEAKYLSNRICDCFTKSDFETMVSSSENFTNDGFRKFLFDFCNTNKIVFPSGLLEEERLYVEFSAYETMLELSNIFLCDEVMECWQLLLSRLLYED